MSNDDSSSSLVALRELAVELGTEVDGIFGCTLNAPSLRRSLRRFDLVGTHLSPLGIPGCQRFVSSFLMEWCEWLPDCWHRWPEFASSLAAADEERAVELIGTLYCDHEHAGHGACIKIVEAATYSLGFRGPVGRAQRFAHVMDPDLAAETAAALSAGVAEMMMLSYSDWGRTLPVPYVREGEIPEVIDVADEQWADWRDRPLAQALALGALVYKLISEVEGTPNGAVGA